MGTAIAAIAHDSGHPASSEVFDWILEADRAQYTGGHQQGRRIDRWRPAGERLTARVITSLNTTMNFHQRMRFSSAVSQPCWPARTKDQVHRRAAMIPALLWPSWSMRLLGTGSVDATLPHAFRAACSTYLLIPGTRLDFAAAGRLLGHQAPRRDRRIIDRLFQPAHLTALASALAQLAHALDAHGSPIDYARRRRLLTREGLRIDHRAYQRLCWEHGRKPGARGRERHLRTHLLELLGAAPADHVVDVATNFVSDYRRFTSALPAWLRVFLLDQAHANLAEHRIDEPIHWEPPPHWVTDVDWPGLEPDDVDHTAFRKAISTCKTTTEAAAALGMTPEHVRLFTELSGVTAPEKQAAPRARGRLIPLRDELAPERLRNLYEDQGLSYQEMAKATGYSNTAVISALTHIGLRGRQRDRPGAVTRAWLEEQCVLRGRSLRGIARECGVTAGDLRKLAEQWGIPVWTGLTRPLPPEISTLPQPLAPDLHRILTSKISIDTLQLLVQLPGQPSLSAAARRLGVHDIRHPLLTIERILGFTIIERTRPLAATGPGQRFLARIEHLTRSLR
ncbi:hypothetical protein [Streptomyces sp. NPDC005181]|uniref:hypothetical protein n=1 Tax=Streptomyces sp. NPDC005181 TaxID=3156869 RepID=UPI0033B90C5A